MTDPNEPAGASDDRSAEQDGLADFVVYHNSGDTQAAIQRYEERLTAARGHGDRQAEGLALHRMGTAYNHLGDERHAIGLFEQALLILREVQDRCWRGARAVWPGRGL